MAKVKKGHTIGDLRRVLTMIEQERERDKRVYGHCGAVKVYDDDMRVVVAGLKNLLEYADRQPAVFTDDYIFAEVK